MNDFCSEILLIVQKDTKENYTHILGEEISYYDLAVLYILLDDIKQEIREHFLSKSVSFNHKNLGDE